MSDEPATNLASRTNITSPAAPSRHPSRNASSRQKRRPRQLVRIHPVPPKIRRIHMVHVSLNEGLRASLKGMVERCEQPGLALEAGDAIGVRLQRRGVRRHSRR